MFENQKLNNRINHIHERALSIVYQDHNSTFDGLGNIEIFKVKMKFTSEIMNEVFDIKECPYPLINELRIKSLNSLNEFRSKIKTWKPGNCSGKLCKIYLQRIRYLQVTN